MVVYTMEVQTLRVWREFAVLRSCSLRGERARRSGDVYA